MDVKYRGWVVEVPVVGKKYIQCKHGVASTCKRVGVHSCSVAWKPRRHLAKRPPLPPTASLPNSGAPLRGRWVQSPTLPASPADSHAVSPRSLVRRVMKRVMQSNAGCVER
eukprot:763843-Hanusia_phi.AAC.5